MRVATWNVNGLRARLDLVRTWLRERRPDVVGLQEIKITEEHFPRDLFREEGYHVVMNGQKGWNGVAILSRAEAETIQMGLPGEEDRGARLITAMVDGLSFTSVYCPNGKSVDHGDYPLKLRWFDALIEHLGNRDIPGGGALLVGDFNICPTGLDSWNEKDLRGTIFHTDAERERFRGLLDRGFHDLFRERSPDERAYTWWDYRAGAFHRGHGLRIDFLLGTRSLLERLRGVTIDRDYRKKIDGLIPSDHAPVIADIE